MAMEHKKLTNRQLEAGARAYCALMDMDPEQLVHTSHTDHPTLAVRIPRWKSVARRLDEFGCMVLALQVAVATQDG